MLLCLRTLWYEFLVVVFFSYWWIQWCLVCCMSGVNSTKIQLSHSGLEPNLRSVFFSQITGTSNLDLSKMHEYNKNVLLCWEQLLYQQLKQTGTNSFMDYQNFYVKIKSEIWSHVTIVLINMEYFVSTCNKVWFNKKYSLLKQLYICMLPSLSKLQITVADLAMKWAVSF